MLNKDNWFNGSILFHFNVFKTHDRIFFSHAFYFKFLWCKSMMEKETDLKGTFNALPNLKFTYVTLLVSMNTYSLLSCQMQAQRYKRMSRHRFVLCWNKVLNCNKKEAVHDGKWGNYIIIKLCLSIKISCSSE